MSVKLKRIGRIVVAYMHIEWTSKRRDQIFNVFGWMSIHSEIIAFMRSVVAYSFCLSVCLSPSMLASLFIFASNTLVFGKNIRFRFFPISKFRKTRICFSFFLLRCMKFTEWRNSSPKQKINGKEERPKMHRERKTEW